MRRAYPSLTPARQSSAVSGLVRFVLYALLAAQKGILCLLLLEACLEGGLTGQNEIEIELAEKVTEGDPTARQAPRTGGSESGHSGPRCADDGQPIRFRHPVSPQSHHDPFGRPFQSRPPPFVV